MNIYQKVTGIIKGLGIECYYASAESVLDEYVVYNISTELDSEYYDDINFAVEYNISIKYLYKRPELMMKYKEIINCMKENGFSFAGAYDGGKENPYYIKEMGFIYKDVDRIFER